jgi:hypothetical protein
MNTITAAFNALSIPANITISGDTKTAYAAKLQAVFGLKDSMNKTQLEWFLALLNNTSLAQLIPTESTARINQTTVNGWKTTIGDKITAFGGSGDTPINTPPVNKTPSRILARRPQVTATDFDTTIKNVATTVASLKAIVVPAGITILDSTKTEYVKKLKGIYDGLALATATVADVVKLQAFVALLEKTSLASLIPTDSTAETNQTTVAEWKIAINKKIVELGGKSVDQADVSVKSEKGSGIGKIAPAVSGKGAAPKKEVIQKSRSLPAKGASRR